MSHLMTSDTITIPAIGLGTWPLKAQACIDTVKLALANGYRLIDTAQMYNNEASIYEGIRQSGIPREDLFITTKVSGSNQGKRFTRQSVNDSCARLHTTYLDLVLIHWPNPSQGLYSETFGELLALQAEGRIKHVGVSNFIPEQFERLQRDHGVLPVINQILMDPWAQQHELRAYHAAHNIMTMAWGPFGTRIERDVPADKRAACDRQVVDDIARDAGITRNELILAWLYHEGVVSIPRSSNHERQLANLHASSIVLSQDILERIRAIPPFTLHYRDSSVYEEW